ncbi:MAG: ThuA domain-containing protein [Actinobacteria bacterium]|nr:ThuA domain-containing protein [Actinomycetota bacterium]
MSTERTALVVRGGWFGHQPVEATGMFLPFLEARGFRVDVHDSPAPYADAGYMAGVDLVVQCMTMSTIEPDELAGLRSAVAAGTGMAGWHGGIADSYRNSSDYQQLIGGLFACHPGKAPEECTGEQSDNYVPYRVNMLPAAAGHPITRGIEDFDLVTEQYWVLADAYVDVLATTTQAVRPWDEWDRPITSPAVWTRRWGSGRLFVCTPGHRVEVLENPSVRTLVERGMLWAARGSTDPDPSREGAGPRDAP